MRAAVVAIVAGALLLVVLTGTSEARSDAPRYRMLLDEQHPLIAEIELTLPRRGDGAIDLRLRPQSDGNFRSPLACDRGRIEALGGGRWRAGDTCHEVHWTVALADHERAGVDASYPVGAWDRAGRWWIVTSRLGWLAPDNAPSEAPLEVLVRDTQGRVVKRQFTLRGREHIPFYAIVSPVEPARVEADGFAVDVYGALPAAVAPEQLAALSSMGAAWRRDLLPAGVHAPSRLALAWTHPPAGTEPGFVASAGSDAVLMHYVDEADEADLQAKLRVGMMLVGGHEAFHALMGALPQRWPTWVNESWATYFAYRALGERAGPAEMALADELVQQPFEAGLATVQAEQDRGDSANYMAFYSKGARFWQAIDAVLVTRESPSGRLAALIQDSDAFAEVDWNDPTSLAGFLDARSDGRASALVRCYVVEDACG